MAGAAQMEETGRIVALDLARTAALVAMTIYHFAFDLMIFGHLPPGTAFNPSLRGLAIATASSFLFLAGVSLVLAQGEVLRWKPFLRRLSFVAGAALMISIAFYIWSRPVYIYFGILHAIATLSVLGLPLRRAPALVLAGLAGLAFALPELVAIEARWLMWTGLVPDPRPALDLVPVFPWAAAFLAGMAVGRAGLTWGLWARLRTAAPRPILARLSWPGRHSLAIYLVHQPVLIALIWGVTRFGQIL